MAKMYGIVGLMSGRLGSSVMAIRNGVQIARRYNPEPSNSSTPKQVEARAKLKTLSQLSEVFSSVIAIPRDGLKSSRNLFTSKNYNSVSYTEQTASIDMLAIKLTDSVLSLPIVTAVKTASYTNVALSNDASADIDAVVYILMNVIDDETLRYVGSIVVSTPGQNRRFEGSLPLVAGTSYVYAYGIRYTSDKSKAYFGNIEVKTAADVAQLIVTRSMTEDDMSVTETRAVKVAAQQSREDDGEDEEPKKKK